MSQIVELPDPVYGALQQAAQAAGVTPQAWIAARLAERQHADDGANEAEKAPKSMADLFAGLLGRFHSGGQKNLSKNCGDKFAEYLEEKRRAGHL